MRFIRFARLADPRCLRAAWWAFWAAHRARRQLRGGGIDTVRLPAPPSLPPAAELGVSASLRLRKEACLVRAVVRQQWHATHGSPRDVVIGVRGPARGLHAHAWLDGDPPCHSEGFVELLRRPVPR